MICNDEELAIVREQLALAESALEALRRRVKNPRNLAVFSEGPVDQINELKSEIGAYLKKKAKKIGVAKKIAVAKKVHANSNGAVTKRTGKRQKV